jgi:hypothetical protein
MISFHRDRGLIRRYTVAIEEFEDRREFECNMHIYGTKPMSRSGSRTDSNSTSRRVLELVRFAIDHMHMHPIGIICEA